MRPQKYLNLLSLLFLAGTASAEVTLAPLFSNDMVIQRSSQAPVWGWAEPGERVSVSASWGASEQAVANAAGRWLVRLQTPAAGGPHSIKIEAGNTISLQNVLSGDIWICGGQSNMEWPLQRTTDASAEIAQANFPQVRHFKVGFSYSNKTEDRYKGVWQVGSPQTAGSFTGVGYYFGKAIHLDQQVPIGLLEINRGGTRIEPWTPLVGFKTVPELAELIAVIEKKDPTTASGSAAFQAYLAAMENWLPQAQQSAAAGQGASAAPPEWGFNYNHQDATTLYHGMLAPILPYAIKGAIWYQGESNGSEARELYFNKMKALIAGWRQVFGQGDFPFYYVQLANLNESNPNNPEAGKGYARVRQGQLDALAIKNTGMAVAIDVGEARDIHPRNKKDVGQRLARWALAKDYGKKIAYSGPLYQAMRVQGNQAILSFEHVGSGLMVGKKEGMAPTVEDVGGKLKWFAIQGQDNKWHWADAEIVGDTVVASSPAVASPKAVRYAFAFNPAGCNLYNRDGLPAAPFTTEK